MHVSSFYLFRAVMVAICLVGLVGCADTHWPEWLTGEPTPEEKSYQGKLAEDFLPRMETQWPNLADVPSRAVPTVSLAERQKMLADLRARNAEAQKVVAAFKAAHPPAVKAKGKTPKKKQTKKAKKK